jgi:hypothetical protein
VGSLTLALGYFLDIESKKCPRKQLSRNEWDIEKPVVQDFFRGLAKHYSLFDPLSKIGQGGGFAFWKS